jgi:hypothetical protein
MRQPGGQTKSRKVDEILSARKDRRRSELGRANRGDAGTCNLESEVDVFGVVSTGYTCERYETAPDQGEFAGGVAIALANESRTCQCDAYHQKRYLHNAGRHTNLLVHPEGSTQRAEEKGL